MGPEATTRGRGSEDHGGGILGLLEIFDGVVGV